MAKAGRRTEGARQTIKQMRELKNDVEWAMVRNQLASAGGATTGRALGSMENWIGAGRVASATVSTSHVLATAGTGKICPFIKKLMSNNSVNSGELSQETILIQAA